MSEVKKGKSGDYYEGVADGIKEHAYTRDGTVYVGTTGATLAEALDAVEAARRDAAGEDKPEPAKAAPKKQDDGENTPVPQQKTAAKDDEDDEDGNAADNATPRRPAAPPTRGRR